MQMLYIHTCSNSKVAKFESTLRSTMRTSGQPRNKIGVVSQLKRLKCYSHAHLPLTATSSFVVGGIILIKVADSHAEWPTDSPSYPYISPSILCPPALRYYHSQVFVSLCPPSPSPSRLHLHPYLHLHQSPFRFHSSFSLFFLSFHLPSIISPL